MLVEGPEAALRDRISDQTEPDDFDAFWRQTLHESRSRHVAPRVRRLDLGIRQVEIFDVEFAGFDGHPIKAWLRVPAGAPEPLPLLVQFAGYGGGRGHAHENLFWATAGYAHFHMDTRGQGSVYGIGHTPDPAGSGPHVPGFLTSGLDSPHDYYYRRVYTDAVLAVDAAQSLSMTDSARTALLGGSQGGGIALAVAGLRDDLAAAFIRVPFLSDIRRASMITDAAPYRELREYLAVHRTESEQVHRVLSYFDGVNFAKRATARAQFSVGLMDPVCPPSTVFGAYNNYAGPKEITVWPYNGHEGGGALDDLETLAALSSLRSAGTAGASVTRPRAREVTA